VDRSDSVPDSRLGLIMGDFMSRRFLNHEGRGVGKSTTPGGHRLVSRKEWLREKKSCKRKEMLTSSRKLEISRLPGDRG
jgi:hypothetical protein